MMVNAGTGIILPGTGIILIPCSGTWYLYPGTFIILCIRRRCSQNNIKNERIMNSKVF